MTILRPLLEKVGRLLLGQHESAKASQFLENLAATTGAAAVSGLLSFVGTFLVARFLGAAEFGAYALTLSLSQLFVVPMTLGVPTALLQSLPRSTDARATVRGSLPVLAASFSACVLAFGLFSSLLARAARTEDRIVLTATGVAVMYGLRYAADAILRGQKRYRTSAQLDVFAATGAFALLLTLLVANVHDGPRLATALGSAQLVFGALGLTVMRHLLGWTISPETRTIASFGLFTTLVAVGQTFIMHGDRVFLQALYGKGSLGVYAATLSGALLVPSFLSNVLTPVLIPTISDVSNLQPLYGRLRRFRPFLLLATASIAAGSSTVFLLTLGHQYPISAVRILLASCYAALFLDVNILTSLWYARGAAGARAARDHILVAALLFSITVSGLTWKLHITGALLGLVATYAYLSVTLSSVLVPESRSSARPPLDPRCA